MGIGHHWHWDRFIENMAREGVHPADAALLPEAQRAREMDRKLDEAETRTKRDWPTRLDYFESTEEFRAAMADPAYKVNEHYRAKVHDMLAKSAPEIGAANIASGESVQNEISGESLLKAARKEAALATYKRLVVAAQHDPNERVALLTMLNSDDPAIQEWIREGTEAANPEGPLQRAFREAGHGTTGSDINKAMVSDNDDKGTDPNHAPVSA
jgi:hypothetical protein